MATVAPGVLADPAEPKMVTNVVGGAELCEPLIETSYACAGVGARPALKAAVTMSAAKTRRRGVRDVMAPPRGRVRRAAGRRRHSLGPWSTTPSLTTSSPIL